MLKLGHRVQTLRRWVGSVGWRTTAIRILLRLMPESGFHPLLDVNTVGWPVTAHKLKNALGARSSGPLRIQSRLARYPLSARGGKSSDLHVFRQVFQFEDYAYLRHIQAPRLILDLGANVGYSSAYFLSRFSEAKVIAVEPDPDNYALCRANLAAYGERALILQGAVWSARCQLALARGVPGDGSEWATRVMQADGKAGEVLVESWDIESLLELGGGGAVDILKVDIEGSEWEVFGSECMQWLPRVRNICIELHGEQCKQRFFDALKEFDYELETSAELTLCRNLRPRHSPGQTSVDCMSGSNRASHRGSM
jgi:FkbM family methyltransferase